MTALVALGALAVWPLGGAADESRGHIRSVVMWSAMVFVFGVVEGFGLFLVLLDESGRGHDGSVEGEIRKSVV